MCICIYIYIYVHIYVHMFSKMYICGYHEIRVHKWQRLKNIGLVTGRPFYCSKACNRIGCLATNPPCDKPMKDCSTLHRGQRRGFVTKGPRQRFVTGGEGGNRDKSLFRATPMCTCIYIYIHIYICIYIYVYVYTYTYTYLVNLGSGISLWVLFVAIACFRVATTPE